MRLLGDENFPKVIVVALRNEGPDLFWARTECAGCNDKSLLDIAESQSRILLTLDKDFWHISLQRRVPLKQGGVVLFRVHPATPENLAPFVKVFVEANRKWEGHISAIGQLGIQMILSGIRPLSR
jgi:predicted nuclease of predicted toxin-antitoxin system